MKSKVWLALALVMILPFMLLTVSCAKKVVSAEPTAEPTPVVTPQPTVAPPPRTTEAEERARRLEEERLRADAAARQARSAFVNEHVHFEFDSSALTPRAQQVLNAKAAYMRANPNISIIIEGHCDERGTAAYNMALGERRAESARSFLVNLGIAANRLTTISYGEERPIDPRSNEEAWAKNRRAQFVIK